MLLLDISVGDQPCLPSFANEMNVRRLMQGNAIRNVPFTRGGIFGCTATIWKFFGVPDRCEMKFVDMRRGGTVVKAVATLEKRSVVSVERKNLGVEMDQVELSNEDMEELEEREKLRRMRISKANKGNTPWNKGRKHSAETLRRIKEQTRLAMQDPKVKMKLINQGHAQSEETKLKIAVGVRIGWEKRRQRMVVQEMCHFEWKNLIAEESRRGFSGEEELQWDSYKKLDEQLGHVWEESVEHRKNTPRAVGSRRAPKSIEQRRKIAEAISAKWSDPDYRNRVCSALAKFHGTPERTERKPKSIPHDPSQARSRTTLRKKSKYVQQSLSEGEVKYLTARAKLKRDNVPKYKDPLASSKLEMIMNIRAQRVAADSKKTAAFERARLMIAEAEKAAKALEAIASKNPHSMGSLIETRKLIKEAIQLIQSIDATFMPSLGGTEQSSEYSDEPWDSVAREKDTVNIDTNIINGAGIKVNGTRVYASTEHKHFHSPRLTQCATQDDQELLVPGILNGHDSAPNHSGSFRHYHINNQPGQYPNTESPNGTPSIHVTNKKWLRGRLVEITEEDDDGSD